MDYTKEYKSLFKRAKYERHLINQPNKAITYYDNEEINHLLADNETYPVTGPMYSDDFSLSQNCCTLDDETAFAKNKHKVLLALSAILNVLKSKGYNDYCIRSTVIAYKNDTILSSGNNLLMVVTPTGDIFVNLDYFNDSVAERVADMLVLIAELRDKQEQENKILADKIKIMAE